MSMSGPEHDPEPLDAPKQPRIHPNFAYLLEGAARRFEADKKMRHELGEQLTAASPMGGETIQLFGDGKHAVSPDGQYVLLRIQNQDDQIPCLYIYGNPKHGSSSDIVANANGNSTATQIETFRKKARELGINLG